MKYAINVPKHDITAIMPIIAQATSQIGLITTATTTEWYPFQLARYIATLDRLSNGRAGWNIVTGSNDRAAQNHGFDAQPPHDVRYEMADEFVDIVTQLWNSWEADAVVMDEKTGVFTDFTKVHPINFAGKYFKCRGPLDTARPPQGRPVLIQAGGSPTGRDFASKWADLILAVQGPVETMKNYRDDVRRRAAAHGRNPDDCKVMYLINPVIGETDEEAQDRAARWRAEALANYEPSLATLSNNVGIDLSKFGPDQPLPKDLTSNGHQSVLDKLINSGKSLRESVSGFLDPGQLVGTPDTVAAKMGEIAQAVGGDGFLFCRQAVTRTYINEIVDGLVPALQKRGLTRDHYSHAHFRDHLKEF